MFKWDGTEVTELVKDSVIEEGIYQKTIYWRINGEVVCMIRPLSNGILPCLIDEIKPIFSLEKIGIHWMKHDNKKILLIKVDLDEEGGIIHDLTLDLFPYNDKLTSEIQKIFAFRSLLGMSKSYEKSIILRKKKKYVVAISFYEPNMEPSHEGKIPNTVLDKWFQNKTIEEVVKDILSISELKEISTTLYNLRIELEKVVKRCDANSIIFVDEILSKIGSCLQHILK